jgi:hypothetical protein
LSVFHSLATLISKFPVTEFWIIHIWQVKWNLCDSLLSFDTMYYCRYTCKILKVCAASIADKSREEKWVTYIDGQNHGRKTRQILFQANGNYKGVNMTIW